MNEYLAHETPDYKFEIDEYRDAGGNQMLLAHIRVYRWSASIRKQMLYEWGLFRQCVTAPLFGSPQVNDARWVKFVTLLGFKPLQSVLCNDGVERPLFIHTI